MAYSQEYIQLVFEESNKMKSLLSNFEKSESKKQFQDILSRLISAAKLEGHDEMVMFGTEIQNVMSSIIVGTISATEQIKDLFVDSLSHLEYNLTSDQKIVDSITYKKLKNLPKHHSIDEKDFFFSRVLKVLFVDSDTFSQNMISKVNSTISVVSCYSGNDAIRQVDSKRFDVLLCELNLPDINGFELIKTCSKSIPTVVISSADDSKIIRKVLDAGAMDYVVKSEEGIRWIPRTIHTSFHRWKNTPTKSDLKILQNSKAKKIVNYLMQNNTEVSQKITTNINYGTDLDKIINEDHKIIRSLVDADILIKNQTELRPACPKCQSVNIISHYLCQKCGSSNFSQGSILEHNKCGHIDFEANFQNDGTLKCPKCHKELKLIGVDYFRTDTAYSCRKCSNIFTNPSQIFSCNNCEHTNFKFEQTSWIPLYQYSINPQKVLDLKQEVASLDSIVEFLQKNSFEIILGQEIKTADGKYGPFDLIATRQKHRILMSILGSNTEESISILAELGPSDKSFDGITSKFAVMFSVPPESVRNLMNRMNIMPIMVSKQDQLLDKFKENLIFNV